ncbi:MAG TPA: tyrosine recombinase XerC [Solimonas sp.]|nr:tyrosine recombinase XerC [Solimonas sp.]
MARGTSAPSSTPTTAAVPGTLLAPWIAEYLEHLRHEKRYSPHTLTAAAADLARFTDHCERAGLREPQQIDSHLVRSFISTQHRAGLQPASLHRYLSSLRSFFDRQLRLGRLPANPALTVRAPKLRRKLPGVIAAEDLVSALDRPAGDELAQRDQAIVELFYSSGLRLAELLSLDAEDVAGGVREVRVTGKGNKQRVVMIGAAARSALDAWLRLRPEYADAGEPALFVARTGRRLSRSAVAVRLKAWAQRSELAVPLHPHRLRHSFATHLLENSGDLRAVQELLGHANLSTTQIYTQLDWKRLASVYDQAHPRARRRKTDAGGG